MTTIKFTKYTTLPHTPKGQQAICDNTHNVTGFTELLQLIYS